MRIERILATVDFSVLSEEVLKAAALLSRKVKGRLTALHVVRQTPFEGHFFGPVSVNLVNQIESKALEELKIRLLKVVGAGEEGTEFVEWVQVGIPFVEIVRYAKQQKIQIIVAGAHGRPTFEDFSLGSVAENLIQKAECPVWMLRGEFSVPKKILLLTDLSEHARAGFRLGLYFARLFEASVHLLHVFEHTLIPSFAMIDPTEHELKMREMVREEFKKWEEEVQLAKIPMTSEIREGNVRNELKEALKKDPFDLIVASTHGQSALFHKHLGSVVTYLARHAPCSLLTVRPESFKFKEI